MATHAVYVLNATEADVTTGALTAKAGTITPLTLDDATTEAYALLDAGCLLVSSSFADPVGGNARFVERAAELLSGTARAAISAGSDPFARAGL